MNELRLMEKGLTPPQRKMTVQAQDLFVEQ